MPRSYNSVVAAAEVERKVKEIRPDARIRFNRPADRFEILSQKVTIAHAFNAAAAWRNALRDLEKKAAGE